MPTDSALAESVRRMIADVLVLDDSDVLPQARFFADLGGESIDMLDLSFQIERQLGYRVNFDRLIGSESIKLSEGGVLEPGAIRALAAKFPYLPVHLLPDSPRVEDLKNLVTVETIVQFVADAGAEGQPVAQAT